MFLDWLHPGCIHYFITITDLFLLFLFLQQLCQEHYKWYQHQHQSLFKTIYWVIIEDLLT